MHTIIVALNERDHETIESLGRDLRSTIEETATGLILYALAERFEKLGSQGNAYQAFKAEVLSHLVAHFDWDTYPLNRRQPGRH